MAGIEGPIWTALIGAAAVLLTAVIGGLFNRGNTLAGDQSNFRRDLIGELDKCKEERDEALRQLDERDRAVLRLQARLAREGLDIDPGMGPGPTPPLDKL